MTIKQAVRNLRLYNKWRRGGDLEIPDPTVVGESIDTVCLHLEPSLQKPKRVPLVPAVRKAVSATLALRR